MSNPPYTVGIDLGTTNCVVTYYSNEQDNCDIQYLDIPQITQPGDCSAQQSLPSFLYQPLSSELSDGNEENYKLPWPNDSQWVCGTYARERGAEVPNRFVSSAKSWLCQSGIDRKKAILPFQSDEDMQKISPFDATVAYLTHLSKAWQNSLNCNLGDQKVIITIPASFDEESRHLTQEAAQVIGIDQLTLLEEPLAALYAWVYQNGSDWREHLTQDDSILVCDVGGGTTDFSLVRVYDDGGKLGLERTAVGEHILLGGDNMDLTLAYMAKMHFEAKGKKLSPWQLRSLWFQCRKLKENLLSGELDSDQLTLLGSGSKLIGGTLKMKMDREEIADSLTNGFFPECQLSNAPKENTRGGLHEMGLPFASDVAVTKHLANFLQKQSAGDNFKWPTHVLFNGGVFSSHAMRERALSVLSDWNPNEKPKALEHISLDNAVAIGAAYYGWAREGKGIRIKAGISRSYYIEIENSMPAIPGMALPNQAICIAAFGMEEGSQISLDQKTFALTLGQPVEFQFRSSNVRQDDEPGDMIDDSSELDQINPMQITLPAKGESQEAVPVRLNASVTEAGVLQLSFKHTESDQSWSLEYSVRD